MIRVERAPRRLALAGAGLVALALGGCSNFGTNVGSFTCPATSIVPDLQTYAALPPNVADPAKTDPGRVPSAAKIYKVAVDCSKETGGVESDITINFLVLRSTLSVQRLNVPYFVALADSTGNILGKQQFTLSADFPSDSFTNTAIGNVVMHLPLRNLQLANVYTLVVGFQLNPAQIEFNRAHLQ